MPEKAADSEVVYLRKQNAQLLGVITSILEGRTPAGPNPYKPKVTLKNTKGGWAPGRPRKKSGESKADFDKRFTAWEAEQAK